MQHPEDFWTKDGATLCWTRWNGSNSLPNNKRRSDGSGMQIFSVINWQGQHIWFSSHLAYRCNHSDSQIIRVGSDKLQQVRCKKSGPLLSQLTSEVRCRTCPILCAVSNLCSIKASILCAHPLILIYSWAPDAYLAAFGTAVNNNSAYKHTVCSLVNNGALGDHSQHHSGYYGYR